MIYLDNAATSYPKAPGVVSAVCNFMEQTGANAGRSSYKAAKESSRIIYNARKRAAELLNVDDEERVCFTMNTTQSLNFALKGLLNPGMTVLTSNLEHNSVMRPLRWLERTSQIRIMQFDCKGQRVNKSDWEAKLKLKPDIVVFTGASNVSGQILPYEELSAEARKRNIPVILDAAQVLGALPVNGKDFDIVCFPGHKGLLGPMGTGGMYISPSIEIDSLIQGGTGSRSSEEFQPVDLPDRMESGTSNIPGLAGLSKSLEFIINTGIDRIRKRKLMMLETLWERLKEIPALRFHSAPANRNAGVLSITSEEVEISRFAWELDKAEIATRMGLHCAPSAHRTLNTFEGGGTIRLSPGYFTEIEEIERVVEAIRRIHK